MKEAEEFIKELREKLQSKIISNKEGDLQVSKIRGTRNELKELLLFFLGVGLVIFIIFFSIYFIL